jgi:hypothetical protein
VGLGQVACVPAPHKAVTAPHKASGRLVCLLWSAVEWWVTDRMVAYCRTWLPAGSAHSLQATEINPPSSSACAARGGGMRHVATSGGTHLVAHSQNFRIPFFRIPVLAQHHHHGVGHRVSIRQDSALRQRGDDKAAGRALGLGVHLPGLAEVGAAWRQGCSSWGWCAVTGPWPSLAGREGEMLRRAPQGASCTHNASAGT